MITAVVGMLIIQVVQPGQSAPPEARPGPYIFPAQSVRSSVEYDCPAQTVALAISKHGKKATITGLGFGQPAGAELLTELNNKLAAMEFDRAAVTCGPNSAQLLLFGARPNGDGGFDDASVRVESPSPEASLVITTSWSEDK